MSIPVSVVVVVVFLLFCCISNAVVFIGEDDGARGFVLFPFESLILFHLPMNVLNHG